MFRKTTLLTLIFLFALPFAHADEASKRAKLEQLFVVMKMDSLLQQVMKSSMEQGKQVALSMFGDKPVTPADQKILENYNVKMYALISDMLSWEKLKPAYLDLYASTYTEPDVDGILAFYQSPAGIDMVAKTPELLTASQKIVMGRVQNAQAQLQDLTKDFKDQILAAHKDDKSPVN